MSVQRKRSAAVTLGLVVPTMQGDDGRTLSYRRVVYKHLRAAFGDDVKVTAWNAPNAFMIKHLHSQGWLFAEKPPCTWTFHGWRAVLLTVQVFEQPGVTELTLPANTIPTAKSKS